VIDHGVDPVNSFGHLEIGAGRRCLRSLKFLAHRSRRTLPDFLFGRWALACLPCSDREPSPPSDLGDDRVDLGTGAANGRIQADPRVGRPPGAFSFPAYFMARRCRRLYIVAPSQATPPVANFPRRHGSVHRTAGTSRPPVWVLAAIVHLSACERSACGQAFHLRCGHRRPRDSQSFSRTWMAVDARANGQTALHGAAVAGQVEVIEYLIAAGADINATDRLGTSPLDVAISEKRTEAAAYLADHGAKAVRGTTPSNVAIPDLTRPPARLERSEQK